jgi:CDP-glycerol glycerophosphotransferase
MPALLDALSRVDRWQDEYKTRYARFRERYCRLEDGHATDRVVELLLAAQGDLGPREAAGQ